MKIANRSRLGTKFHLDLARKFVLKVFSVSSQCKGADIHPTARHPLLFKCSITPRSEIARALIRGSLADDMLL